MGVSKNKTVRRRVATCAITGLVKMFKQESTWWKSDKDQVDKQIR